MSRRKAGERQNSEKFRRAAAGGSSQGLWLYGLHPVRAALLNPKRPCRRLLVTAQAREELTPAIRAASERMAAALLVETAGRDAFEAALPPGAVHQGAAVLVGDLPEADLHTMLAGLGAAPGLIVLLDQVTDPHNIGAVLRSAAAFGAAAILVQERHTPAGTATLAKAASGALEMVPLVRVINLARAIDQLKEAGFWLIGLDSAGDRTLAEAADWAKDSPRLALALGAEGEGLRRLTREACDVLARIPTAGKLESLNVSNAAAVAMYALWQSRTR